MINQIINKTTKSVLLLGPRQVGKSTLMKAHKCDLEINLNDEKQFLNFSSEPGLLKELCESKQVKTVFIDEVQRLPTLLNTIQVLIDEHSDIRFFLTGSSARKLKRGGANLLPGRVVNLYLSPLIAKELDYQIDSKKALEIGTLPGVYTDESELDAQLVLSSYASSYLKEEIKAEALVRDLSSFSRFLNSVIAEVGNFIDQTKLAKRSKINRHQVPRYFEILEDTLIAHRVYPLKELYHEEDLIKHPKFYFFDNGVFNGLMENFTASVDRKGLLAKQLVFNQILFSARAQMKSCEIFHYRTRPGIEVDFIVLLAGELIAIEVKSSDNIIQDDTIGLNSLKTSIKQPIRLMLWHMGNEIANRGEIEIVPWQEGIKRIGL